MRVARWGEDLVVRLPAEMVERLGLKEGDDVALTVVPGDQCGAGEQAPGPIAAPVPPASSVQSSRSDAIARLRANAWTLPAGYRFDREEANAR